MSISTVILGASGYTGVELLRLIRGHRGINLEALVAEKNAGKPATALYGHLHAWPELPILTGTASLDWSTIQAVFACLPHGASQAVIAAIPEHVIVFDLSADFRLRHPDVYVAWYGHPHQAVGLQKQAVYGLTEWQREAIRSARLIACPGCYPTSAQLPLWPLLKEKLIATDDIIIDAKSGVSGAGRKASEDLIYTEVTDSFKAYGVGKHRHQPEIEQGLSEAADAPVRVTFTPHLVPMRRGILSTIYVKPEKGATLPQLRDTLERAYRQEPFVHLLPEGVLPATRDVRGSNHCFMTIVADHHPGRFILISVIDNLVKGASGQALQNFNCRFGFPETEGLEELAEVP